MAKQIENKEKTSTLVDSLAEGPFARAMIALSELPSGCLFPLVIPMMIKNLITDAVEDVRFQRKGFN